MFVLREVEAPIFSIKSDHRRRSHALTALHSQEYSWYSLQGYSAAGNIRSIENSMASNLMGSSRGISSFNVGSKSIVSETVSVITSSCDVYTYRGEQAESIVEEQVKVQSHGGKKVRRLRPLVLLIRVTGKVKILERLTETRAADS
jgi:hypothetical protein